MYPVGLSAVYHFFYGILYAAHNSVLGLFSSILFGKLCTLIFTFVPCILVLSKFYLFTNWCGTYWGCFTSPCVGSAEWERSPRPTFCVNARLWPHSDMCTWASFAWSQRILGVQAWGAIWNYSKVVGLPWFDIGAQRTRPNQGLVASGLRGPEPNCKELKCTIVFLHI